MAASDGGERASLGCFAKKQTKYGSMSSNAIRREKFIVHVVRPDDTLQGIALKYGVTMEEIKRANKLWSADCLFLRPTLSIPVPANIASTSTSGEDTSNNLNSAEIKRNDNGQVETVLSESDDSSFREESLADFLIRIDSSIAQTKDKIKCLQHVTVHSDDDLHVSTKRNHKTKHRHLHSTGSLNLAGSTSLDDLSDDLTITPHPVVMTGGRRVRSSLQKLERQQDEIFEL